MNPQRTDPTPTPKVVAATLSGAATVIIMWLALEFGQIDIPAPVGAAIATVVSALFGYITSER